MSYWGILTQDRQENFAGIGHLELELSFWRSVFHLTPTIDHLYIEQPQLTLERLVSSSDQSRFSFSDIVDRLASRQTETNPEQKTETATTIPGFRSRDIHLSQGSFQFHDQITGARLAYHGLDFSLQQLDTQALTLSLPQPAPGKSSESELKPQHNKYTVQITGADQGQLQLSGQFQLQPLEVSGNLSLQSMTLAPFWPFAAKMIPARLTGGVIDFHSDYHLSKEQNRFVYSTQQGQFTLQQLVFQDAQSPKVKLSRLALDNIGLNSSKQQIDIAQLQLSGLWTDALLNRQGLDLQRLFTPVPDKPESASPEPASDTPEQQQVSEPWLVRLHQLQMTGTDLNLTEQQQTDGVHWRLHHMSLSTGEILSDLSQPIDYQLALDITSDSHQHPEKPRGHFTTQGTIDAKALQASGDIHLQQLDISQFQPYLQPYLNLQLSHGLLSTQGHFSVEPSNHTALYQGKAALNQLMIKDTRNRQPLLKWESMAIDAIKFDQAAQQLTIHEMVLDKPYAKILIAKDRKTNIDDIVVSTKAAEKSEKAASPVKPKVTEPSQTTEQQPSFQLEIGAIRVRHGSAFFADQSLTPNFASGIESLEGEISHLSSTPGTKALVNLTGKIDQYAPVTVKGEVNPLSSPPYLDLDVGFHSVELTSVNPYSGTYAGYYIDKGQLSLGLQYQLENNQLIGKNHIVIDQLQLGKASHSDQALNLPLKLAIALLQDRNGVIDLGLDISGDLDNPSFSFGSIIMTALTNMIAKAVTAPFALLAGLVGSDDELNIVRFDAGSAVLSDTEKDRLKKLSSALTDRPKLRVSAEGLVSFAQDSQVLKEMKLKQELQRLSGLETLPADLSASRFPASGPLADTLNKLFQDQLQIRPAEERLKVEQRLQDENPEGTPDPKVVTTRLHIGMYNQLLNAQTVSHDELGYLAQRRAQAVKAFLVNETGLAPERIFLLDSKTELSDNNSQVTLTLSTD
ncbi:DUF748 domain-containing protein [Vibrio mangrovi]|uniref:DUF748 domain-containing protein n=1 Tax=Vibrio mangrovi TaxID=474394 RepID=A0ABU4I038_9VIBR|nr:DUF748 domain-containing protein [Vibrio mangrovi]MDW6001296.1 DUF748 domain-containing protein [Vibrio mangrovi]